MKNTLNSLRLKCWFCFDRCDFKLIFHLNFVHEPGWFKHRWMRITKKFLVVRNFFATKSTRQLNDYFCFWRVVEMDIKQYLLHSALSKSPSNDLIKICTINFFFVKNQNTFCIGYKTDRTYFHRSRNILLSNCFEILTFILRRRDLIMLFLRFVIVYH